MKVGFKLVPVFFLMVSTQISGQTNRGLEQDRSVLLEACQTLKSQEKKSICQQAVNRLSQGKSTLSAIDEKVDTPVREPITLKGVPFDTPGSIEVLIGLCLSAGGPYSPADLKKWCSVINGSQIPLPNFSFGNLPETLTYARVNKDGSLIHWQMNESKGRMLELAALLGEKYGKPSVTDTYIENALGTKFDQKIFVWVDQRGTRITIHSIFDKVERGQIVIESSSLVRESADLQKSRIERGKANL